MAIEEKLHDERGTGEGRRKGGIMKDITFRDVRSGISNILKKKYGRLESKHEYRKWK
jgi:hypothetical protein